MTLPPPTKPKAASPGQLAGLKQQVTAAAETVRGIVHDTQAKNAIPAPELDPILAQLEDLAYGLDQALRQLAGSLLHSLAVWDLRDDAWDTHPATSVAQACDQLDAAATHAWYAARNLAAASAVTAGQTYLPAPEQTTGSTAVR